MITCPALSADQMAVSRPFVIACGAVPETVLEVLGYT